MSSDYNRVEYLVAGDSHSYQTLEEAQEEGEIDGVVVFYQCPYCNTKNRTVHSTPIPSGCVDICDSCKKDNTITPADSRNKQYRPHHMEDQLTRLTKRRRVKKLAERDPDIKRNWRKFRLTASIPGLLIFPLITGMIGFTAGTLLAPTAISASSLAILIAGLTTLLSPFVSRILAVLLLSLGLFSLLLLLTPIGIGSLMGIFAGGATAACMGSLSHSTYQKLAKKDSYLSPQDVLNNNDILFYGLTHQERREKQKKNTTDHTSTTLEPNPTEKDTQDGETDQEKLKQPELR